MKVTTQGNHKGLPLQQYSYTSNRKYSYVGAIPCGCPESLKKSIKFNAHDRQNCFQSNPF